MNLAQWIVEANAISQKEREAAKYSADMTNVLFKAGVKAFRDTLIQLLGTNIGAPKKKNSDDWTPATPLVMFIARPEVLDDALNREKDQEAANAAVGDVQYDAMNTMLMSMSDADMLPILDESAFLPTIHSAEVRRMLSDIGVDLADVPEEARKDALAARDAEFEAAAAEDFADGQADDTVDAHDDIDNLLKRKVWKLSVPNFDDE